MTKYREILRLQSPGFSERNTALSCCCSRNMVSKVLKRTAEMHISWPLNDDQTGAELEVLLFPRTGEKVKKRLPDIERIRKELLRNGVNRKLLWSEYLEECRQADKEPFQYSQFCYYIQQDEQKRRATMHTARKPGEKLEVDWAGDPAHIIDPDTGAIIDAYLFVAVMSYSLYAHVEAFTDEKQHAWITTHVHMYAFFGGVTKILVPDNCKTAVTQNGGWYDRQVNAVYHELAELLLFLPESEPQKTSRMQKERSETYRHGLPLHCVMNSFFPLQN